MFDTDADIAHGERCVLDMDDSSSLPIGNSLFLISHMTSPDVHVDSDNRNIVIYFHVPAMH